MSFPAPQSEPRYLEWDTRFFGVRIASVAAHGMSEARWREMLAWCRAERIECIYLLSKYDEHEQHARAEAAGALRVDERTTLSVEVPDEAPQAPDPEIRLACEADLPALRALAASAHTNSRFWKDPGFARERCADLYSIWIERDFRELSTVFVPGPVGEPRGYVTASYASGRAMVGLLAVAPSARRQGLGRRLMLRAFEHVREAGHRRMGFITQGPDNIALRLYESLGSQVERHEVWHHLWFPNKA
jgi:ribosomal protein S18 acetylase RimI-like enzyme